MISFDFALVFSFGLLGSLHCVQMCGPIVLAYSMPMAGRGTAGARRDLLLAHLAYNAGRISTYIFLGALAGAAGQALGLMGRLAGIENTAAIAAGVLLLIAGLSFAGILPLSAILPADPGRFLGRMYQAAGRLLTSPTPRSKFALGLGLGFLPCGFLYAGLLKAVATGTPTAGAVTMLAFGLGTAGAMIATGMLSSMITAPLRRWSNVIGGIGMILLGSLLVYRGVMAHGMLPDSNGGGSHSTHGHH